LDQQHAAALKLKPITDMEQRPIIAPPLKPMDMIMEIASGMTLIVFWAFTLNIYQHSPDIIPIHFDVVGNPDQYGAKTTLFILPALGTLIYLGMTVLNRYPHTFNYPAKITAENAATQYALATRLIRFLKLATILVFLFINYKMARIATGKATGLGWWFLPLALGLVFIPIVFYLRQSTKKKH
jgi:uncharacterized membrane protein